MLQVYVDGSYTEGEDIVYGAFIVLDENGNAIYARRCSTRMPVFVSANNVGAELLSAVDAIKYVAQNFTDKNVRICYDYVGIYNFLSGEWKPKKPASIAYVKTVNIFTSQYPDLRLSFKEVPAHSGVKWNEIVDKFAKGIITTDIKDVVDKECTYG